MSRASEGFLVRESVAVPSATGARTRRSGFPERPTSSRALTRSENGWTVSYRAEASRGTVESTMNRTALSGPGRPSEEQALLIDHDQDSRPFLTILTPQGRGAVAVVRVWGRGAVAVADAVFRPARGPGLARAKAARLRLGRIGRGLGDEVVAVVIEEDPPVVEIQCHGGSAAVGLVVEALERGRRPACRAGGLGRAHRGIVDQG